MRPPENSDVKNKPRWFDPVLNLLQGKYRKRTQDVLHQDSAINLTKEPEAGMTTVEIDVPEAEKLNGESCRNIKITVPSTNESITLSIPTILLLEDKLNEIMDRDFPIPETSVHGANFRPQNWLNVALRPSFTFRGEEKWKIEFDEHGKIMLPDYLIPFQVSKPEEDDGI